MAQPRWCVYVEIQNTAEDVTSAPLPKTIGVIGVVQRGVLPGRVARTHLAFYGRDQNSDLTGFFRLDPNNLHSPVTKGECVDIPPPGEWAETEPIDFITDAGEVSGVKSEDSLTVRIRARWDKADTTLMPLFRKLRVQLVKRRDNTPFPPAFVVLDTHTFSISTSLALYTAQMTLDAKWGSNTRYLLRCFGRFKRQVIHPP
jgi:hypothetical protein